MRLQRLLASALTALLWAGGLAADEPASRPQPADENPAPAASPRPDETPGTRLNEWRKEREQRFASIEPYKPGFLERQILAIEKAERPSILQFNVFGFYPRAQSIASGSRTAIGGRLWRPDISGTPWDVHGSVFYSMTGYEFYDLQVGRIPHKGKSFPLRSVKGDDVYELGSAQSQGNWRMILYGSFRYRHYPEESFYGLGADTRKGDRTSFLFQDASYELVGGYQFTRNVALTLRGGYQQVSLAPGEREGVPTTQERFADPSAPGLLRQPDFLTGSAQLFLDFRDEPGNPHSGVMLALQLSRWDDRDGDAFEFTRFAADARAYLPLGSKQRVLALRALLSTDDPGPQARVPFYLQETLGGSHTLRGYDNFRFRGHDLLLLQAEYRWEAAPALELALFADAGKVEARAGELDLSGLRHDLGFGVRLKTFDNVLMRFDMAWSREQTRYLFRFSPSF